MPAHVTADELFQALDDALVLCEEFAGADMAIKLQAFGLNVDEVKAELQARLAEVRYMYDQEPHVLYTQGFMEGILAGVQLVRRALARVEA